MSDDRTAVAVPENAVRDEPIAFGLTGVQLGVMAGAAVAALLVNLAPLPGPVRIALVVVAVGPLVCAAVVSVGGEPLYRLVARAVRHRTTNRSWLAVVEASDKPQISDEGDTVRPESDMPSPAEPRPIEPAVSISEDAPASPGQLPAASDPLASTAARLRLVRQDDATDIPDEEPTPSNRDDPIPHLVAGLRIVTVTSFAGGVGKTMLATELATLLTERGRYRTLDGLDHALSVLIIDAARLAPAVGLRLGLDPVSLARLPVTDWGAPEIIARGAVVSRGGAAVLALPSALPLDGTEGFSFGATAASTLLDGADRAGYGLVVADLGSVHEEGHRHLIDQSSLVLGVVRPTIESMPDVLRLATYLRGLGMGRKLALVANDTGDDRDIRRLADEAEIPLLGQITHSGFAISAADRGEPLWRLDPVFRSSSSPSPPPSGH